MKINDCVIHFDNINGANSYLYISEEGDTSIIDSGMPGNEEKIISQINKLGLSPEQIRFIILTHSDIDHIGSAAKIRKATGAMVAIHEDDYPCLSGEKKKRLKGLPGFLLRILDKFIQPQKIYPDIKLQDGDLIGGLKVVHCPGHTDGSISLYDEKNILFSGDAVITSKSAAVKGFSKVMSCNTEEATKSLFKIAKMKFDVMLPGHGKPVLENASNKVMEFSNGNGYRP